MRAIGVYNRPRRGYSTSRVHRLTERPGAFYGEAIVMNRRTGWMGLSLALLMLSFGCGSDKGGSDAGDSSSKKDGGAGEEGDGGGGNGGSSGNGGSGAMDGGGGNGGSSASGGNGGTGGTGPDEDAGVEPCGTVECVDPQCCADPFQSLCGVGAGRACLMPPPEDAMADDRCPSFNIASFSFPSCCTDSGDCGLSVMMFGAGCLELSQFKMAAESMGAPANIGIPDPQKCD